MYGAKQCTRLRLRLRGKFLHHALFILPSVNFNKVLTICFNWPWR